MLKHCVITLDESNYSECSLVFSARTLNENVLFIKLNKQKIEINQFDYFFYLMQSSWLSYSCKVTSPTKLAYLDTYCICTKAIDMDIKSVSDGT